MNNQKSMIVIVDYGIIIFNPLIKLEKNGIIAKITSDPDEISKSDKLVLAVGHFQKLVKNLNDLDQLKL